MMRRVMLVVSSLLVLASPAWSQPPADETLPRFGDYVYVEELPEAVTKAEPWYPDIAREAGVQGTVIVQALVDRRGDVASTRVVKSIPMLDQAAVACVRRWHFKPAMANGRPVAVWIAVPIKFTLHGYGQEQPGGPQPPVPAREPDRGAGLSAGRYFINADSTDLVIVTDISGNRVRLESPGQWEGTGVVSGSTYWGVFVYRDDAPEPKNRGARGTHLGTLEPSGGRVRIRGTFANRPWGEFQGTWTPRDRVRGVTQLPDPGLEMDSNDLMEHPVWPPERGRTPGPDYEHPVWPPEWSHGDRRILLAEGARVDVLPEVIRRVEPEFRGPVRGRDRALVVVRARIERDGTVSDTQIAQSEPALDDAALRAVRQWRFRPARRAGHAVSISVYIPVQYQRH
jgi:TonB family protein